MYILFVFLFLFQSLCYNFLAAQNFFTFFTVSIHEDVLQRQGGFFMDDSSIVQLYWNRSENAVSETDKKYGRYLKKISFNILNDPSDSAEAVNDTYLRVWNSIPPHRPQILRGYLAKITRELSIDLFRRKNASKRRITEYSLSLEELNECVSGNDTPESAVELSLLTGTIESYLRTLSERDRNVFLMRYFFLDPLSDIAASCGMTQSAVKSLLFRLRSGLKTHLKKEGFLL
ncbi:MAG: sigma-70 family RNA polymerase sigma factor [Ruminococcaceae bacterium]|nr:sigma-70 family RNA polymerase sigma factor [Oscillospiraceae bacterium]